MVDAIAELDITNNQNHAIAENENHVVAPTVAE
jgi:hypothetical protein